MRKINKITAILALLAATVTAGCTGEFENFNTNHHEATEDQLEQDNLKTGAFFRQLQRSVIFFKYGSDEIFTTALYQLTQNLNADSFAGYFTGTLISGNGNNMGSYNVTAVQNWLDAQYNYTFTYNMSAWLSLHKVAEELGMPEVDALGTIVKVAAMHRTTDYYGPIPYTSFGNGQLSNSYDTQEAVYRMFFNELDEAIDTLTEYATGNPGATIMADYDYIYGGNSDQVTKWIKFANTLRLRLALRVVYADESLARTEALKSINHSIGCMSAANDIAQLNRTSDLATYYHPLHEIAADWGDTAMGASIDTYMNGYRDPRLSVFFNTSGDGGYHGVRPGWHSTTNDAIKPNSGNTSSPKTDNSTMAIVWMFPSEALFLKAEAALRGWGGDAATLYNQAIQLSFDERGAAIGSYMNAAGGNFTYTPSSAIASISGSQTIQNVPSVAWNEGDTFEKNLERIAIQRWIATFPNGAEGWAIARRTGYPRLITVVNNDSNGQVASGELISRLVFPISESLQNPSGYASGVSALGGIDSPGTHLWWDCK